MTQAKVEWSKQDKEFPRWTIVQGLVCLAKKDIKAKLPSNIKHQLFALPLTNTRHQPRPS